MQSDRHARIGERAYQIWVAEGRIDGRHDEHWQRAEREIAAEELRVAAALADRAAGAAKTTRGRAPATSAGAKKAGAKKAGAKKAGTTATGKPRATPAAPARPGRQRKRAADQSPE